MERIESKKGYVFTQSGDIDKEQRFFTKAIWVDESYPKENFIEVTDVERRAWENDTEYRFANPDLAALKKAKVDLITDYDTSDNVNGFYVGGIKTWLDKADRVGLMNSTNILIAQDYKNTDLWLNGNKFTIPCEALVQMLGALEVYALQCYSVTEAHKKAVNDAESIEELDAIDITVDYPEMPRFEL